MLRNHGPYLVFRDPITPTVWVYFAESDIGTYICYEMPYPTTTVAAWVKKPLDNNARLYALDNTTPFCYFLKDNQLFRVPLQIFGTQSVVSKVEQPSHTHNEWCLVNQVRASQYRVNPQLYPALQDNTAKPLVPSIDITSVQSQNNNITSDQALSLLHITKCAIVENETAYSVNLPDNEMCVWKGDSDASWHYRVAILGKCFNGTFSTTLDNDIVRYLNEQSLGNITFNPNEDSLRIGFSRPYLKLTHEQQGKIIAMLHHGWPILDNATKPILTALYHHILRGDQATEPDYTTIAEGNKKRIAEEHTDILDTVLQCRSFLNPHTVNASFSNHFYAEQYLNDPDNATINDIILFVNNLFLAALKTLGDTSSLPLPILKECYHIPCGQLTEDNKLAIIRDTGSLSPEDSHLFLTVMNYKAFKPEQNKGDLETLSKGLQGIIEPHKYQHRYMPVANDLLAAFAFTDNTILPGQAKTYLDITCLCMLISIDFYHYNSKLRQQSLAARIIKVAALIQKTPQLIMALTVLPKEQYSAFITALGNKIAIADSKQLAGFFKIPIPKDKLSELIIALKKKISIIIQNSDQLFFVLKSLPIDKRYLLIIALGNKISTIITDYKILKQIFALLPKATHSDLIIALDVKILTIITNEEQLPLINKLLPTEMLSLLNTAISIQDIQQLKKALRLLPKYKRYDLAITLRDKIWMIIKCGYELSQFLMLLPEDRRYDFVIPLGDKMKAIVKTDDQFADVLTMLPKDKHYELITMAIRNDYPFASIFNTLPQNTHSDLIFILIAMNSITTFIAVSSQLVKILNLLPEIDRYDVIVSIINNSYQLPAILNLLPKNTHSDLIDILGDNIGIFIQDASQLQEVLRLLDENNRYNLIITLGSKLKTIVTNINQLTQVVNLLAKDKCSDFIVALGDSISTIIRDNNQLVDTLELLDEDKRAPFITALGPQIKILLTNTEQLVRILRLLPKEKCDSLLTALDNKISNFIQNSQHLSDVILALTEQQSFQLIMDIGIKVTDFEFIRNNQTMNNQIKEILLKHKNILSSEKDLKKYSLLMTNVADNEFRMKYGVSYDFFLACALSSMGVATLIIAFSLLNVASFNLIGLGVAAVSVAVALSSIGFYRAPAVRQAELASIGNISEPRPQGSRT